MNQPPTAVASATPASGTAPLNVAFIAAGSSDPDGSIASYQWAFGDGTTGWLQIRLHETFGVAQNVSWIVINWRAGVLLVVGIIFFLLIIGGLVLNTIFLAREVRRNEQYDAFINEVTHELKTPITSIRLYLETLQRRARNAPRVVMA